MTRLFLAAGVAALAIAAPAAAGPGGGGHGNDRGGHQAVQHGGGGGGHGQGFARGGGGGGHGGGGPQFQAQAFGHGGGHGGHGGGFAAPRMERQQSFAMQQHGRSQHFAESRGRPQQHAQRQQVHGNRHMQAQNRNIERQSHQHMQANNRAFERQQVHGNRNMQANNRALQRQQGHGNRMQAQQQAFAGQRLQGQGNGRFGQQALARQQLNGRPLAAREFRASDRRIAQNQQAAFQRQLNTTRFAAIDPVRSNQILAPAVADRFVGVPVSTVSTFAALAPIPATYSYLYPATADYYYLYGGGYAYQIDWGTSLVAALFPLLAGGYLPGQYLPAAYMASYVPAYYGFNAFYPDYGNICHRYGYGVIYEVDCFTGMVMNVIPLYAAGYGVGQILPTSYAYYNVPYQYRSMYYDTPDYNYWYAPGAIYQYEPHTSMITSVAALLSPGFAVGQPLPVGYGVYNVPYAYRSTYYDTPTAWYRYNNGYIYQVDPATQLVTAIVASLMA